jgi:hypothetical protein
VPAGSKLGRLGSARIVEGCSIGLAHLPSLQRLIHGNSCQPGRESRLAPELIEMAKCLDERILHGFFGIIA